ncbi:MAG: DUF1573 domain-containing protein [Muribaculaceae bacterium]|nr:DUF1573 domain-containing protein [Muribaculaceae bacterium]
MKRILSIFAAMIVAVAAWANPKVDFAAKTHDFGTIKEADGAVTCEFEFTNTGTSPLVVVSANAECGCTKPQYPMKPIKPGEKGKIKVTFLPAGYKGEFVKQVKVKTNDKKAKTIRLKISGVVIPK